MPSRRWLPALAAAVALASLAPAAAQVDVHSPAEQDKHLAELVIESARRGPVVPVPLVGEGSRVLGSVYDRFATGVAIARFLSAAGQTVDGAAIMAHQAWQARVITVVAYPITCEGNPNRLRGVRWRNAVAGQEALAPLGAPLRGTDAQPRLPGVTLPDDALVVSFRNAITTSATVEIDYAEPHCRGAATTATLAVNTTPSRIALQGVNGVKLPAEITSVTPPATVRIHALIDTMGRARFGHQSQGPRELLPAATALITQRTFDVPAINGVPTPIWMLIPIVFTATGEPGHMEPYAPAPPPGATITTTTSTISVPSAPTARPPLPPAPPGALDTSMARLAIEVGSKGDPVPIPLDAAGPVVHGVLFDRFLVGAVRARAAFLAGTPIDPSTVSTTLVQNDLVAVAYSLACGERRVAPVDVAVAVSTGGTTPGTLRATGPVISGAALSAPLPGVTIPDGAIARTFVSAAPSQNLEVRITYADSTCAGDSKTAILPIHWARGTMQPRQSTFKLPPDAASLPSPTIVTMRGLVDLEGRYRFPDVAQGPPELAATAIIAAAQWRFLPYRANGAPMPQSVVVPLTFTASGAPEPPSLPAGAPPPPSMPVPSANTTIAGRPSIEIATPTVAGLTASGSRCAIAEDAAYGFSTSNAIKIGGGPFDGPARHKLFLSALRGPDGQGLNIARRGSMLGPDQSTILDVYEISYPALAQPVRIYLDSYHAEPLKAPKGFVCAAPFEIR